MSRTEKTPLHWQENSLGSIEKFFKFVRERYTIKLRRNAGQLPWTKDPVLKQYRFCNVFREDDKTTAWFRYNLRQPLSEGSSRSHLIIATIGFRWFNKIETGELIKYILLKQGWNARPIRSILKDVSPLITGAYMIKTPAGMNKLEGILWCMRELLKSKVLSKLSDGQDRNLQEAHSLLQELPYMGPFMAYEIVTDLRHTPILIKAKDIMSWANPGPGCVRGAGWIVDGNPDIFSRHSKRDVDTLMWIMRELLSLTADSKNWPSEWPSWEMRDVEHCLCEFDKYCRAKINGQRLKRKFECSY